MDSIINFYKRIRGVSGNAGGVDGIRTIYANDLDRNVQYPTNRIRNTKYTWLTFIPLNLIEQFGRAMNIYFLMIGVLQLFPSITPVDPISTWGALIFIFAISAIKEGFDDYNRSRRDRKANERIYTVIRNSNKQQLESQYIMVGDIIYLTENEEIPCDIMVLSTSDKQTNSLYVQTSNLDGETDLKIKYSIKETSSLEIGQLKTFQGVLECPVPNKEIGKFDSRLSMRANRKVNTFSHSDWLAVDSSNLVLQATHLKNTDYIYGLVVYTGNETKLGKNKMGVPTKWTKLDKQINRTTIIIFCIQLTLVLIFGFIGDYIRVLNGPNEWYLDYDNSLSSKTIIIPLRFLLLNSMMIPISLKVTIDVIKYIYALFINWDLKMYYSDADCPATANSTALSEDLGQIEYIFTDKTGTLTENIMLFSKCSIDGIIYHRNNINNNNHNDQVIGDRDNSTNSSSSESSTNSTSSPLSTLLKPISVDDIGNTSNHSNNNNNNNNENQYIELKNAMKNNDELVVEFFRSLSLCHTIVPMPTIDPITGASTIQYKSSSPDEEALVNASRVIGAKFTSKTPTSLVTEINGSLEQYQLLHTFEFTSDRKRMSVVVRDITSSQIKVITKGADEIMFKLLSKQQQSSLDDQQPSSSKSSLLNLYSKQIDEFASHGLRTLCLAQRNVEKDDYEKWYTNHYQKATTAIQDRSLLLAEAYNLLERDLNLLGITAIEDKLQDDVPRTIECLRQASIKIWMLTGDKYSTAIQIANSCNLIETRANNTNNNNLNNKHHSNGSGSNTEGIGKLFTIGKSMDDTSNSGAASDISTLDVQMSVEALLKYIGSLNTSQQLLCSIIVEGHVLTLVLLFAASDFLKLSQLVGSLICCRVTPSQKAQVVKMIKDTGKITLAIGDGGNDVSMIQEANIGIGISGREGLQASRSADYSIGRFKYLSELVLVHGRYSYLRTSFAASYSFYKSMFICFIQILYQLFSGFAGTSFFNSFSLTTYNILFTGLPVVGFIFDKDLPESIIRRNPYLYSVGQDSTAFNTRVIAQWIIRALVQAIFVFTFTVGPYVFCDTGSTIDYNSISMISFTSVIFIQSLTLFFESHTITWINQILIWGTIPIYFVCLAALNAIPSLDTYTVITHLFESGSVWLSMLLMILVSIAPIVTIQYLLLTYKPTINEIIHQIRNSRVSKNYKKLVNDNGEFGNQHNSILDGVDDSDSDNDVISSNYNSTPVLNNNGNNNNNGQKQQQQQQQAQHSRENTFKYQLSRKSPLLRSRSNQNQKQIQQPKVVDLIVGAKEEEENENKKLYDLRQPPVIIEVINLNNNNDNDNNRIRGNPINIVDNDISILNSNSNNTDTINNVILNNITTTTTTTTSTNEYRPLLS